MPEHTPASSTRCSCGGRYVRYPDADPPGIGCEAAGEPDPGLWTEDDWDPVEWPRMCWPW